MFAALDLELPTTGSIVEPRTIVVSLLVGTLVASVLPASRATRIAPIAAVREGGVVTRKLSRRGLVVALALVAISASWASSSGSR